MAVLTTYDAFLARISNGFWMHQPFWGELQTASVTPAVNSIPSQMLCNTKAMPSSLPTGVTSFIPVYAASLSSTNNISFLIAKLINLGNLNIGTNTFTDGSAMPTVTELGASNVTSSMIFCEVTTALNATPGNLTVTYVDQSGNTAEAAAAFAMPASAPAKSGFFVPLNSTDSGAQDITTAAQSAGTTPSGVVKFWGVLPICFSAAGAIGFTADMLLRNFNIVKLGINDVIGVIGAGSTAVKAGRGEIFFVGDS